MPSGACGFKSRLRHHGFTTLANPTSWSVTKNGGATATWTVNRSGRMLTESTRSSIRIRHSAGLAAMPLFTKVTMHRIDIISYF